MFELQLTRVERQTRQGRAQDPPGQSAAIARAERLPCIGQALLAVRLLLLFEELQLLWRDGGLEEWLELESQAVICKPLDRAESEMCDGVRRRQGLLQPRGLGRARGGRPLHGAAPVLVSVQLHSTASRAQCHHSESK